jgi:triphosphoribosyl-dephospho-CoA synthase
MPMSPALPSCQPAPPGVEADRLEPARVRAAVQSAYLWACALDVAVRKPGNVSLHSAGHDMRACQFVDSACASAPALFDARCGVGARIEAAVRATRAVAGCNTNLGILLLCAPLARAAERLAGRVPPSPAQLQSALETVLDALDLDDARAAYRAIATAHPGGLGTAPEQDVAAEPGVDLRAAMRLAADRDLIARQYANGYADVFALGLAAFAAPAHQPHMTLTQRVQRVYLAWLATHPDSHIVRKQGEAAARAVAAEAAHWRDRLASAPEAAEGADFAAWDESLKARGLNPGTSADLVVCTLFVAALLTPVLWTQGVGALDVAYGTVRDGACAGPMEQSLLSS